MARTRRKAALAPAVQAADAPAKRLYLAGGYIRLSIEDSGKAGSETIETQRTMVEGFIREQPDLRLYDMYCDNGRTGTNFDRPDFDRMLEDVQAGRIDCIVVKDLSRFGRNYKEAGNYLLRIFPFLGVRFISINDHFDTLAAGQGDTGFLIPLKNMLNEAYSRDISRKISSAIKAKELHGDFWGVFAPYGYSKSEANHNQLEVNPETAPVVREIFAARMRGEGYTCIARQLNGRGVPCPGAYLYRCGLSTRESYRDALWTAWNIKEILRNEVYLGRLVQGRRTQAAYKQARQERYAPADEWRIVPNAHEALIDEDTFTAVQKLAAERGETYRATLGKVDDLKTPNLFRKLIFCADCGKAMNRRHVYNRKAGGRIYYYSYKCVTSVQSSSACTPKNLKESELLATVTDTVRCHLAAVAELEERIGREWDARASGERREITQHIQAAEQELSRSKARMDGLYQSLVSGILNRDEYLTMKQRYSAQCGEITKRLDGWKQRLRDFERCGPSNSIFAVCRAYQNSGELTEELTHALIKRIDVHDHGRIEIELAYQDELQQLARFWEGATDV